jgi:hypothetical protein
MLGLAHSANHGTTIGLPRHTEIQLVESSGSRGRRPLRHADFQAAFPQLARKRAAVAHRSASPREGMMSSSYRERTGGADDEGQGGRRRATSRAEREADASEVVGDQEGAHRARGRADGCGGERGRAATWSACEHGDEMACAVSRWTARHTRAGARRCTPDAGACEARWSGVTAVGRTGTGGKCRGTRGDRSAADGRGSACGFAGRWMPGYCARCSWSCRGHDGPASGSADLAGGRIH